MGKIPYRQFVILSFELLNAVKDSHAIHVYATISRFNPSFPSYEKIAELTGLSRSSIRRALNKLENIGAIRRVKVGRNNHYETKMIRVYKNLIDTPTRFYKTHDQVLIDSKPGSNRTSNYINNYNKESDCFYETDGKGFGEFKKRKDELALSVIKSIPLDGC